MELDEGTRRQLESIGAAKTIPAGAVISDVSEVVEAACLIVEGAVRLESPSADGERFIFGTPNGGVTRPEWCVPVGDGTQTLDWIPSEGFKTECGFTDSTIDGHGGRASSNRMQLDSNSNEPARNTDGSQQGGRRSRRVSIAFRRARAQRWW